MDIGADLPIYIPKFVYLFSDVTRIVFTAIIVSIAIVDRVGFYAYNLEKFCVIRMELAPSSVCWSLCVHLLFLCEDLEKSIIGCVVQNGEVTVPTELTRNYKEQNAE